MSDTQDSFLAREAQAGNDAAFTNWFIRTIEPF